MSARAQSLDLPLDPDLRVSASWREIPNPKNPDEYLPWVVESFCGRYTITWSVPAGADATQKIFLLWRRHPLVNGRRPVASLLGRYGSAREARLAAGTHAEANP